MSGQRVYAFTADSIGGEPRDRVLEVHGFRWIRGCWHVDVTVMGPRGRFREEPQRGGNVWERRSGPLSSFTLVVHEEER